MTVIIQLQNNYIISALNGTFTTYTTHYYILIVAFLQFVS